MVDEAITTDVDALINLLKENKRLKLEDAAKKLDVPISVLQSWVDFLVEEKIIGMEYKFTTAFIYLNEPEKKEKKKSELIEKKKEEVSMETFKMDFSKRAADKKISQNLTGDLWKNHLMQRLDTKKEFFFREAKKKGFFNPESLWGTYKQKIMDM